jgi:hypothetical protein
MATFRTRIVRRHESDIAASSRSRAPVLVVLEATRAVERIARRQRQLRGVSRKKSMTREAIGSRTRVLAWNDRNGVVGIRRHRRPTRYTLRPEEAPKPAFRRFLHHHPSPCRERNCASMRVTNSRHLLRLRFASRDCSAYVERAIERWDGEGVTRKLGAGQRLETRSEKSCALLLRHPYAFVAVARDPTESLVPSL